MNFFDRPRTLLEDRQDHGLNSFAQAKATSISDRRRGGFFFVKPLALALILLSSAEVFAQSIKLGYAALTGTLTSILSRRRRGGKRSRAGHRCRRSRPVSLRLITNQASGSAGGT